MELALRGACREIRAVIIEVPQQDFPVEPRSAAVADGIFPSCPVAVFSPAFLYLFAPLGDFLRGKPALGKFGHHPWLVHEGIPDFLRVPLGLRPEAVNPYEHIGIGKDVGIEEPPGFPFGIIRGVGGE